MWRWRCDDVRASDARTGFEVSSVARSGTSGAYERLARGWKWVCLVLVFFRNVLRPSRSST